MSKGNTTKQQRRTLRHGRVRSVISGSGQRPRLSIFRSSAHIYAQLIDDQTDRTIAAASSRDLGKAVKVDQSTEVGKLIAARGKDKGVTAVVFDRGGYRYHGRVKALADGARAGGLEF